MAGRSNSSAWWIAFGFIAVKVLFLIIIAILIAHHVIKKNILKKEESKRYKQFSG
jgi:cell division protein FtsN